MTSGPHRGRHEARNACGKEDLRTVHPSRVTHLERLLRETPTNPILYSMLGTELRKLSLHDQAIEAFRRAIDLQVDHLGVYLALAETLEEIGCIQDAREALLQGLSKAMKRNHELAVIHFTGVLERLRARG